MPSNRQRLKYERVIVSLPKPLVAELRKFAGIFRDGNKSGFVADAIRFYVDSLRKTRHTRKLREAYAAAAEQSLQVARQWQHLDEEAWARLDKLEAKAAR